MKISFYEVQPFSPNLHEFTGSIYIILYINIISPFLAQKLDLKKLSKSGSGYYKTKKKKKKKKWHGPLSHWCREGKTLVVRPLKKTLFFNVCLPLLHKLLI